MDLSKIIDIENVSLKDSKEINEKYIQEYIANDPTVLGLGDLILKDKERVQANAGRLDLLFQDSDTSRRYEIELQLGKTDESHIIRTIEYWDNERKKYPQYDHCAVIIAENVTARFLNVIQLFNGQIPLIAIQMNAFKINDKIAIKFTKILDELKFAIDEEDEDVTPTDRQYWENKSSKDILNLCDEILKIINEFEPSISVKYNKYYIGLVKNGIAFNFAILRAKKKYIRLEFKLDRSDEIDKLLEDNDMDLLEYGVRSSRYKIKLTKDVIKDKNDLLKELLQKSYNYFK